MSPFIAAQIYDPRDNSFVGWVILRDDSPTFVTSQYYREGEQEELQAQLARLQDEALVLHYWPRPDDPEVQTLLADETFEPVEMEWQQVPVKGPDGKPVVIQEGPPDRPWEEIYQTAPQLVAKSPVEVAARIKTASELVARARIARAQGQVK